MKTDMKLKKDIKEAELINKLKEYVEDNELDISRFRKENRKMYNQIYYYFGDLQNLMKMNGWHKKIDLTLKDELALYALNHLMEDHSFATIGEKFNVSRACVRQLFNKLNDNKHHSNETSKFGLTRKKSSASICGGTCTGYISE